jgi:ArsR family transcriptional regulator, arsenate/arsenite/antimonite-responsive transcriptional repressor
MGASKGVLFSNKHNKQAATLKALAHPARIAIVEYLCKVQACVCGEIVDELPLAQSTISQHLKELKAADIIKGAIDGNAVCYCINEKAIEQLGTYFTTILKSANVVKCC